jgi:hypothetical protein
MARTRGEIMPLCCSGVKAQSRTNVGFGTLVHMKRPDRRIRVTEIDPSELEGATWVQAKGWVATFAASSDRPRAIVAWLYLRNGDFVGLVFEGPQLVPADTLLNFSEYRPQQ